ncbi:hypothetical protein Hanom_Chr16g01499681 [Helianthus anomalus]
MTTHGLTVYTSVSSQTTRSENQVSSTTPPDSGSLTPYITVAIEDVNTTLFKDLTFAADLRTFNVPFSAGSSNFVCAKNNINLESTNMV